MRMLIVIALAGATLVLATGRGARAEWCAYYDEYTYSCGFRTFEQCLDTIRGVGGVCRRDQRAPAYGGQEQEREERRRREPRR